MWKKFSRNVFSVLEDATLARRFSLVIHKEIQLGLGGLAGRQGLDSQIQSLKPVFLCVLLCSDSCVFIRCSGYSIMPVCRSV